jgi:hypothetical protein
MDGAQAEFFAWYSAPDIAADPSDTGVLAAVYDHRQTSRTGYTTATVTLREGTKIA